MVYLVMGVSYDGTGVENMTELHGQGQKKAVAMYFTLAT
jgi:hypothetical protein